MASSSSNIPLVDLSLSQEDELPEVNGRKRKDIVHIVEDSPAQKRHRTQSTVDKSCPVSPPNGFDSMLHRLETLESLIVRTPSRHEEDKYVTREEFQDLVKEFKEIKQKVLGMEKIFEAIKRAFLPPPGNNITRNSVVVPSTIHSDASASNVTASIPAQQSSINSQRNNVPSNSSTPRKASAEASTLKGAGLNPRRISAPSTSLSVRKVISPAPRKSCPNQEPRTANIYTKTGVMITPVRKPQPQASVRLSPSQSSNQHRNSNADPNSSASITRSLAHLSEPPEQDTSATTSSNCNINDLTDDMLRNVRIKQEVLEHHHLERIDSDQTRSFRKDGEDNILVYIDGGGNKCRNRDLYVAYAGHSLHDKWVRVSLYQSDLNVASLRKDISIIKKQAEIIAAYFAIEDLKRNSTQRPLKIRIVTKTNRLVTTMTNLQGVYYCFGECACEELMCVHQNRWTTVDTFASTFPDDLPRLAFAMSSPDLQVSWRTYSPAELDNKELWDTFKRKFKDLKNK